MSEQEKIIPISKITELDKMSLEIMKLNKKVTQSQAEKAIAYNELADLNYKYTILQIYIKYGLNENDAINENGEIIRGGANTAHE